MVAGAAAYTVRLLWDADENCINVEKFQCFIELLGFGNGGAVVGFAGHDQRRSLDLGDEVRERTLHVVVGVFPGKTREPILGDERDVGSEREAVPIDDRIEGSRGAETIGVLDGPAGKYATAAAAGDEEIVGVDVALGDNGVDSAVQVVKIVAGICVVDKIGKI